MESEVARYLSPLAKVESACADLMMVAAGTWPISSPPFRKEKTSLPSPTVVRAAVTPPEQSAAATIPALERKLSGSLR